MYMYVYAHGPVGLMLIKLSYLIIIKLKVIFVNNFFKLEQYLSYPKNKNVQISLSSF